METTLFTLLRINGPGSSVEEVSGLTTSAKRVGLYARVSTHNGHQDPEVQLRELRAFAQARGWTVAGEYVDRGVSCSKERRPELQNPSMSEIAC